MLRLRGKVIIGRLARNRQLRADVMAQIVARTDGIPLVVEEMTKAVLEAQNEGEAPTSRSFRQVVWRQTIPGTSSPKKC